MFIASRFKNPQNSVGVKCFARAEKIDASKCEPSSHATPTEFAES
jgi:hypothetical protein